jgi:hypothetical protein
MMVSVNALIVYNLQISRSMKELVDIYSTKRCSTHKIQSPIDKLFDGFGNIFAIVHPWYVVELHG